MSRNVGIHFILKEFLVVLSFYETLKFTAPLSKTLFIIIIPNSITLPPSSDE